MPQFSDLSSEDEIKMLLDEIAKRRKKISSSSKIAVHLDAVFAAAKNASLKLSRILHLLQETKICLAYLCASGFHHFHRDNGKACSYGIGNSVDRIKKAVKSGSDPVIAHHGLPKA